LFESRLGIDHYRSQPIFFTVCTVQQIHEFNYLGRNISYVNNDVMCIISYIDLNIYVNVYMYIYK